MWVVEDGNMVNRKINFVPGLYKIFDEILGKILKLKPDETQF